MKYKWEQILTYIWKKVALKGAIHHLGWPIKPCSLRQMSPLKAALLNPAGSTWQLKVKSAKVEHAGLEHPQRDLTEPAFAFSVRHVSYSCFSLASHVLCWEELRVAHSCIHLFMQWINRQFLHIFDFVGMVSGTGDLRRLRRGYIVLNVTRPQKCGNPKIWLSKRFCGNWGESFYLNLQGKFLTEEILNSLKCVKV